MDEITKKNNGPTSVFEESKSSTVTSKKSISRSESLVSTLTAGPRCMESQERITSKDNKIAILKSIQFGIKHSLTEGLSNKVNRDVLLQDFKTFEVTTFESRNDDGVELEGFVFKTYAPVAFRFFRFKFGIRQDDYHMSFCNAPLRELSNPGASGSTFFITWDDEFILKTTKKTESKFLRQLLPGYLLNLNQNPYTLLPKFYGFYYYKRGSKRIRLLAMNNFIPFNVVIHQKYDLKGSTHKRAASKSEIKKRSPTFKDLDFRAHHPDGLFLEPFFYRRLVETVQKDCRVLESFKIMDFSLLLCVHNVDQAQREREERRAERLHGNLDEIGSDTSSVKSVVSSQGASSIVGAAEGDQPNVRNSYSDKDFILSRNGIPATGGNGEKLLLFVGIIDILESYRLIKKLEHTYKLLAGNGDTVSTQNPRFYAQRFLNFVETFVFKKTARSSRTSMVSKASSSDPNTTHLQPAKLRQSHSVQHTPSTSSCSPNIGNSPNSIGHDFEFIDIPAISSENTNKNSNETNNKTSISGPIAEESSTEGILHCTDTNECKPTLAYITYNDSINTITL